MSNFLSISPLFQVQRKNTKTFRAANSEPRVRAVLFLFIFLFYTFSMFSFFIRLTLLYISPRAMINILWLFVRSFCIWAHVLCPSQIHPMNMSEHFFLLAALANAWSSYVAYMYIKKYPNWTSHSLKTYLHLMTCDL